MANPEISIVIPHRGNALGLWATVHSCEQEFEESTISHDYVIVTNGGDSDEDTDNTVSHLKTAGLLGEHLHFDSPLSPPVARQRGAQRANGRLICFFDNHCLVGRRYFDRVVADFDRYEMDMLHSATQFYAGQGATYHYRLKLDYNFWAESDALPEREMSPYRIAAAGHGGFVVRRDVWEEVGGYGPESLLQGYGGEELLFDLKMWRQGKNNWLDPKLLHYHYAGSRGYSRHFTDEYYVNLMTSALVVGGENWLYKVYESFAGGKKHLRLGRPQTNMYDLLMESYERGFEYSREVSAKAKMTLDELLVYFRQQQIAC